MSLKWNILEWKIHGCFPEEREPILGTCSTFSLRAPQYILTCDVLRKQRNISPDLEIKGQWQRLTASPVTHKTD